MKKLLISSFLLLTSISCSMGGIVTISDPSIVEISNNKPNNTGILEIDGLSISVKPENHAMGLFTIGPLVPVIPIGCCGVKTRNGDIFEIVIQFESSVSGFKFDPYKTELIINDKTLNPMSVAGPSNQTVDSREHFSSIPGHNWRCKRRSLDYQSITEPNKSPTFGACYFLRFSVLTPDPSVEFSLKLKGLTKDNKPINAPLFIFKKGHKVVYFLLG